MVACEHELHVLGDSTVALVARRREVFELHYNHP